jgi:hypothetical protein
MSYRYSSAVSLPHCCVKYSIHPLLDHHGHESASLPHCSLSRPLVAGGGEKHTYHNLGKCTCSLSQPLVAGGGDLLGVQLQLLPHHSPSVPALLPFPTWRRSSRRPAAASIWKDITERDRKQKECNFGNIGRDGTMTRVSTIGCTWFA